MKAFFESPQKEKTELHQKQQQKKEYKLIASARHKKGMTLFSYNTHNGDLKPAEYQKESSISLQQAMLISKGHGDVTRKVVIEKDCIYFEALNMANARKKISVMEKQFGI